jgi:YD repeat-containing protein
VTDQDGSIKRTAYSGNCTTVTDEAGKARKSCVDGLGRMTQVFEDPSGLNYETDYSYDALGNLFSVNQKGGTTDSTKWRTRTFSSYDGLSRLLTASNPENGTVTYAYDSDANCPSSNSLAGNLVKKVDARGIRTCLQYDGLDRLTQKSFSDTTTPTINYFYDQTSYGGLAIANGIGHRTSMTDAAGSEAWSYDSMSRVAVDQRTTNGVTKTTTYSTSAHPYYYDGSIAQLAYPSGRAISYSINTAAQYTSAVDTANNVSYATLALYTPNGALSSLLNGTNLLSSRYYNNRLQPCRLVVNSSGTAPNACADSTHTGNVFDFTYNFNWGTSDNSTVAGVANNRDSTRSQTFGYDALNRLLNAQTTSTYATNPSHCWGESYQYDNQTSGGAWGNLTNINGVSSAYNGCKQEGINMSVGSNNHLLNLSNQDTYYDAAGNMTTLPSGLTLTYNAEEQLTSVNGITYLYDGEGKRVAKKSGGTVYKIYWYGVNDAPLVESDGSGNITDEFIFFDGRRIARRLGP